MKPFHDIYGKDSRDITEGQLTERNKILQQASALVVGARYQGRDLNLESALQLAVDSVTGGRKEEVARQSIQKTLKDRNQAITMKPGNKKPLATSKPGGTVSRDDLAKRVQGKLAGIFN